MLTLQEQYNSIKLGKGAKDVFLKHAKALFPQYIPNHYGFEATTEILFQKQVLNEVKKEVETTDAFGNRKPESWENKFNQFLTEEKKKQETKVKADLKKTDKSVEDLQDADYDNTDIKNADNVIFDQYLRGIYTEMSSDSELTLDKAKKMVLKNLSKDPIWYTKNSAFGIKDIGYTDELPGTKASKTDKSEILDKTKQKSNVKDTLGKKEKSKGTHKNIKTTLTNSPKKSKGVKVMDMPGKEKIIKLKENQSLTDLFEEEGPAPEGTPKPQKPGRQTPVEKEPKEEDFYSPSLEAVEMVLNSLGLDNNFIPLDSSKWTDFNKSDWSILVNQYNKKNKIDEDIQESYQDIQKRFLESVNEELNYYQELDPKAAIQKAEVDYNFALKKGNDQQADKIANNLKSHLEKKGYEWKKDPKAIDVLADFIDEARQIKEAGLKENSFESRLKEMVSKVLEGPLEDADAKLAKDQANKESEAANIEKQRADNKVKIANANKSV